MKAVTRTICFGVGLMAFATPASADQAKCESDARAAMTEVFHPVAMRQNVQMVMGNNTTRNTVISTPDKRGLTMNEQGVPVSLFNDGKFYTTSDGGKNWKLMSESTPEQQRAYLDGLAKQALEATNIECAYGVDLDGKTVDRFSMDYALYPSGMKMKGTYWRDAQNGFPWRIETVSPHNTIIQDNEPAPNAVVEVPD
ncbi:hypothetical protein ACFQ14_07800 [Pseudahrensia aquimaris]|uniref:Uncharacterized protein n=1 Tax=Pseudahrensia aquimaris TaxID=744461 RepID=A0ABW3FGC0_9HYPH